MKPELGVKRKLFAASFRQNRTESLRWGRTLKREALSLRSNEQRLKSESGHCCRRCSQRRYISALPPANHLCFGRKQCALLKSPDTRFYLPNLQSVGKNQRSL